MEAGASTTAFDITFGLFVLGVVVLLVLVVPFILRSGAASHRRWFVAHGLLSEAGQDGSGSAERPITALVLGGGGTRGAVQVGMLQVLSEHGFVPDLIYGASVGAVNGAVFAGDPTREGVERLTRIWWGIRADDVYPQGLVHGPWQFVQQRPSVHPNSGIRRIVEDGIGFDRLEDAAIPIEVVATSLTDGHERWLTSGPAVEAVLASAAIPAIFPPVEIDGDRMIDGGVVNNVPIGRAIDAGATRIVVLLCGPPTYAPLPARRPIEVMINALFIAIHARFVREVALTPPGVEVIVCSCADLGGGQPSSHHYTNFSDTEALILAGRAEAAKIVHRHNLGGGTFDQRAGSPDAETPPRISLPGASVSAPQHPRQPLNELGAGGVHPTDRPDPLSDH